MMGCTLHIGGKSPILYGLPSYVRTCRRRGILQFGKPPILKKVFCQQRRYGTPVLSSRSTALSCVCAASFAEQPQSQNPFQQERNMDAAQKILASLPTAAFYVGAAVVVLAAGGAGFVAGARAPPNLSTVAKIGGALLGGALAALGITQAQGKRSAAAAVELYNSLVHTSDPASLTRQQVEQLEQKFGASFNSKLLFDVQQIYGTFLESQIPVGNAPLTGMEAGRIRSFKAALGLSDEDAAPVHIDVGRRIVRSRAEAGSRTEDLDQRKTFQKLVYVSSLVFGEQKASFLLPWKRQFNMNDAQLYVAKRDHAKALFSNHIKTLGGQLEGEEAQLRALRQFQTEVRLGDEEAAEAVKEAARGRVEAGLDRAIAVTKRRTRVRDYTDAIKELKAVLQYNQRLVSLAGREDMPPGLASVTVFGGRLEGNRDLRELYRIYLEEGLKEQGGFTDGLEGEVRALGGVLALGPKEATALRDEVTSRAYRRMLREEFSSGRLEAAPSKAAVLSELCDRLKFDGDAATALHKSLYRQKLDSLLEKKRLTDADAEELSKLRKMLCLSKADVEEIHKETCGRIYKAAVEDALAAGIDRFSFDDRNHVKDTQKAVLMEAPMAKEILAAAARRAFLTFISQSRNKKNKLDAARELKRLVFFSNVVVAPLLEDLQKDDKDKVEAAKRDIADLMARAKSEMDKEKVGAEAPAKERQAGAEDELRWVGEDPPQVEAEPVEAEATPSTAGQEQQEGADGKEEQPSTLAKATKAAEARAEGEKVGDVTMKSQKEITLKDDLDIRDRLDIYRNFLLYCMSGDVIDMPMGSQVVVERDEGEFARLSQLGDVLGLTQLDVSSVHTGLAEQAYRNQVQGILANGNMTREKSEALTDLRNKLGLSEAAAGKIIKGVQNQRLISGLQASKAQGALTLEKVLDMKQAGVEVETFVSEDMRLDLFRNQMRNVLSAGTGEFDEEQLLKQLPADLSLDGRKVERLLRELASDRKRTTLVQAISFLRQRKLDDTVKSLNNLLVCNKALKSNETAKWEEKEELQDLYSVYIGREKSKEKQSEIAQLLGISSEEAGKLEELVEGGQYKLEQDVEEEAFF